MYELMEQFENQAVRCFLMLYGGSGITVGEMANHMSRCGYPLWPDWVEDPKAATDFLSKSGAQAWLRHLFAFEYEP